MRAETAVKLAALRERLAETGRDAALIGLQPNFSWLAAGGEAHVPVNTTLANGRLLATADGLHLLANAIETPRLLAEELRRIPVSPATHDWFDGNAPRRLLREIADPKKTVSDTGEWGTRAEPALFAALRQSFLPSEVRRYRELGRLAEAAVAATIAEIAPGMSEQEAAARLSFEAWRRGLTPTVMLIAFDQRIRKYRHPLPTRNRLKRLAMIVLSARRGGQIVAMTRLAHFGPPPADLTKRHHAVCAVDAAFHARTVPGAAVKDAFQAGLDAYAARGFPEEWKRHHQGGATGYLGREFLASARSPDIVKPRQPFAWNPSIAGTKSEDTILAIPNARQPEVITRSPDWPMIAIDVNGATHERPAILER